MIHKTTALALLFVAVLSAAIFAFVVLVSKPAKPVKPIQKPIKIERVIWV